MLPFENQIRRVSLTSFQSLTNRKKSRLHMCVSAQDSSKEIGENVQTVLWKYFQDIQMFQQLILGFFSEHNCTIWEM